MRPIIIQEIYNPNQYVKIRLPNEYAQEQSNKFYIINNILKSFDNVLSNINNNRNQMTKNETIKKIPIQKADHKKTCSSSLNSMYSSSPYYNHLKSESSESIDSGNCTNTFNCSSSDSNFDSIISETKRDNLKKLIIAEKISPYKLKIETSTESPNYFLFHPSSPSLNTTYSTCSYLNNSLELNHNFNEINELNEDDLEFLLANTDFSQEQILKWYDDFFKKCPNGFIKFDQFKNYYTTLLPNYLNDISKQEFIKRIFSLFDIDCDGVLNFTEFLVSFWIRCKAPIEEKYTWIFNMIDSDRNGYLSYNELRNALKLCLNTDDLDMLLKDLNKDKVSKYDYIDSDESDFEDEIFMIDKKYSLLSRTNDLIEDKLNETIFLLDSSSKNDSSDKEFLNLLNSSSSSFTSLQASNSMIDYFDLEKNKRNFYNKIQISRENFLYLSKKYKYFRKLLVPIKCFYDENF